MIFVTTVWISSCVESASDVTVAGKYRETQTRAGLKLGVSISASIQSPPLTDCLAAPCLKNLQLLESRLRSEENQTRDRDEDENTDQHGQRAAPSRSALVLFRAFEKREEKHCRRFRP